MSSELCGLLSVWRDAREMREKDGNRIQKRAQKTEELFFTVSASCCSHSPQSTSACERSASREAESTIKARLISHEEYCK